MQLLNILLTPISLPYRGIFNLVQKFKHKESFKPPFFTISIGNIQMGGTGKTPLILDIISKLKKHNDLTDSILYISRGYNRKITTEKFFFNKWDNIDEVGDEAKLIMHQENIFSLIGKNRRENIKKFISSDNYSNKYEIAILDDGFQHLSVQRDLDIVLINVSEFSTYLGYETGLPFFKLREPLSALKRADIIIFTKNKQGETSKKIIEKTIKKFPNKKIFFAKEIYNKIKNFYNQEIDISKKRILLLSGIADNKNFKKYFIDKKVNITKTYSLKDHYNYNQAFIDSMKNNLTKCDYIITTEKDFVKLKKFSILKSKLLYLEYRIEVDGLAEFIIEKYDNN